MQGGELIGALEHPGHGVSRWILADGLDEGAPGAYTDLWWGRIDGSSTWGSALATVGGCRCVWRSPYRLSPWLDEARRCPYGSSRMGTPSAVRSASATERRERSTA